MGQKPLLFKEVASAVHSAGLPSPEPFMQTEATSVAKAGLDPQVFWE